MVWLIISCIVYFAVIAVLLVAIHIGREKLIRDRTPVSEENLLKVRNKSRLFNRTGAVRPEQNVNGKKGDGCLTTLLAMLAISIAVGLPCLVVWLVNRFSAPAGYTKITTDLFVLPYILAGLFGSGLVLLPFAFLGTTAFFKSLKRNREKSEFNLLKEGHIFRVALLFVFIFTFPFFVMGLDFNASYNEREILYNPFFSYNRTVTKYEEVSKVERYFHRDANDNISSAHYIITLNGGYTIDTLFSEPTMQTYKIHGFLKAKNPALLDNLTVDDTYEDIMKFLKKEYDEEAWPRIFFIFDLDY